MDQDRDKSHVESLVNLLTLPTELLVYIISFLSSLHDRVKLRYVSRWLRYVIEGTPSLWREFVWPYYDSSEECSVKEVLKVCGQHIKMLSFPYSKVTLTRLVEMLQYCSNVQHLSLPSTKLDPEQLRMTIHHMGCLQTLELKVDNDSDIKQLFLNTGQLRELTIILNRCRFDLPPKLFKYWKESQFKPPSFNVISSTDYSSTEKLVNYATQFTTIPTGTTANFRLYNRPRKLPLNLFHTLPYYQLQVEGSGQVTIPCVKLSDFGILGLDNDVALMTDCQCGGRTLCMVMYLERHQTHDYIVDKTMDYRIGRFGNLSCVTHFDLSCCFSLRSGHLEQLAVACPNLQRLNLQGCYHCLESLQGLQTIASHCHNLQGLNLFGICTCVSKAEDRSNQTRLWEILSNMKLIHLGVEFCVLRLEAANKEKLICLYQKCWTIRGIQCSDCDCEHEEDTLMLSYFPSLNYCYLYLVYQSSPTIVKDVISNCTELKVFYCVRLHLSLNLSHNHNLQQLYIDSPCTDVPDHFMTSVSAHGGLEHVFLSIGYLTFEGITSLVRNSPKLMTLYLCVNHVDGNMENYNIPPKNMFWNRKLFTAGHRMIDVDEFANLAALWEQGMDLLPLWRRE
ncbi:uncharacterized protein [Dysidea avara]|uniref:uncharacterized protein n=1 Tax=Dysidea avara TaxID=196820 RepID=UPI0033266D0B